MENGHNGGGRGFARPQVTRPRGPKPPFLPQGKSRAALPEKEVMQVSPVPAQPLQHGPARPGQSRQDRAPCAARALGRRPPQHLRRRGKRQGHVGPDSGLWAGNVPGEWDCRAQGRG